VDVFLQKFCTHSLFPSKSSIWPTCHWFPHLISLTLLYSRQAKNKHKYQDFKLVTCSPMLPRLHNFSLQTPITANGARGCSWKEVGCSPQFLTYFNLHFVLKHVQFMFFPQSKSQHFICTHIRMVRLLFCTSQSSPSWKVDAMIIVLKLNSNKYF
jgi:hypothetical protein